ncbi:MAG: hypothetical protein HOV96_35470 [Nonomuraea sp.]|nr:hypothetical protein [Nonomuraea sp.]NUP61672.1 hypothetical protein [Nonomuraea sp.]NUP82851.1 hypothetical protein [Nonomuraea sp.]NUS08776.1 hypothetical protein [Nonomuraea sp.]
MRNFIGVIALLQGLGGFAGRVWFDSEWGLVGRFVELPVAGYLVIAAIGVALLVWGDSAKKRGGS